MQRKFVTDTGQRLTVSLSASARLGAGGQGQVFIAKLASGPVAVKLIAQPEHSRLLALRQLPPACAELATLPQQLIYEASADGRGALAGYVMRYIDKGRSLSAARLFNFDELQRLKRFTWRDAVLAALRVAEMVAALHGHGVVIGDLNPENVLFEQQSGADGQRGWRAIALDTDSFQIEAEGGVRHHCPVSRPLYTAPELISCDLSRTWREVATDHFALAVLIYQLLLHDHPFDNAINADEPDLAITAKIRRGLYPHAATPPAGVRASPWRPAPREISGSIDNAFRRSFCDQPGLRPSAAEWVLLLRELHGQVVPCIHSVHHHHPSGRACLWCAVEQRIGAPICRFPTAAPPATAPAAAAQPAQAPRPQAAPDPWQQAYPELHLQLRTHHQRCQHLLQLRTELIDRLLSLDTRLGAVAERHGDPQQLVDPDTLALILQSLRSRLRRWLGLDHNQALRQAAVEKLHAFAASTAAETLQACARLSAQQKALLHQLTALDVAPLQRLVAVQDPDTAASARLQRAQAQAEEQWLSQQLEQEAIRSWNIEGFGQARLALLESHGLFHGNHLRQNIDRLTALPGLGRVLQERLRSHLNGLITRLRAERRVGPQALEWSDLVDHREDALLPPLDSALQGLQRDVKAIEQELSSLEQQLRGQLQQRDLMLKGLASLR
jgi:DNA-binding helix-hairpin-helix protein with protein kinase domain